MADNQNELRQINWAQTFGFTHIFKSFKMAIHPSKLVLCLAAVVVVFMVGWAMDGLWTAGGRYVRQGEIGAHFAQRPEQFARNRDAWEDGKLKKAAELLADGESEKYYLSSYRSQLQGRYLKDAFGKVLNERNKPIEFVEPKIDDLKATGDYEDLLARAKDKLEEEIARAESILKEAKSQAREDINAAISKTTDADKRMAIREDLKGLVKCEKLAEQELTRRRKAFAENAKSIQGDRIFASLLTYERHCANNALAAVRYGNLFGGLQDYRRRLKSKAKPDMSVDVAQVPQVGQPAPADDRPGFVYWCLIGVHGLGWLASEHWLYAIVLLLATLAVVAFFGGAVHRIAALHFTREEKISIKQALKFSCGKFLSFFTAPLIPLVVILGLGVAFLTVGGLVGSIPVVGELLMGFLFVLALAVGLVIAFLTVGLAAGAPLMYPTIAVEGSDSFDAISRSFTYVFARPWRAAFYGLVALVYGVVTYVFVRLFIYIAMAATHMFVNWGTFLGGDKLGPGADKLDVMWQTPTFDSLTPAVNWVAMSPTVAVGAWLLNMWVFLLAIMVLAYLLSFAACSTTCIYCLLRRKEDATDLDDVFIEEEAEQALETETIESDVSEEKPESEDQ